MVGVARKRRAQYPHVAARQADVTQLPCDEETCVFRCTFPDAAPGCRRGEGNAEVTCVLRPGGSLSSVL